MTHIRWIIDRFHWQVTSWILFGQFNWKLGRFVTISPLIPTDSFANRFRLGFNPVASLDADPSSWNLIASAWFPSISDWFQANWFINQAQFSTWIQTNRVQVTSVQQNHQITNESSSNRPDTTSSLLDYYLATVSYDLLFRTKTILKRCMLL